VYSSPVALADGSVVFIANDGVYGLELWRLDDVWAPTVRSTAFKVEPRPSAIFNFSENVAKSLSATDLTLRNLDTNQLVTTAGIVCAYDAASDQAVFTFSNLPDGHYRATLVASGVTDIAGNTLANDAARDFNILAGDANQDGAVDFSDLVVLAQNYNTTSKTFAQGDFNYDGSVDFNDLVLLAQRYNTSLPGPGAIATAATDGASLSAAWAAASQSSDTRKPVFSSVRVVKPKPPIRQPRRLSH
jgi:ELWxxDGT repeat protein